MKTAKFVIELEFEGDVQNLDSITGNINQALANQMNERGLTDDEDEGWVCSSLVTPLTEKRVYIVDMAKTNKTLKDFQESNEVFMQVAEEQGTVYSLEGFEKAFNTQTLANGLIKIL